MARPPKRKLEDAKFRCIDEDFIVPGKMEYVRHQTNLPGGGTHTEWVQGQARANCPNDFTHRIELVEE
jgi:hypothetical protein